jgi:hypothetical protein
LHNTEREKTKNKRQKDTNITTKHKTLRRGGSEAIPVLKKRIFSYFYCSSNLLWRTVVVIGLVVARRPAISKVTMAEIIQKLKRKIW